MPWRELDTAQWAKLLRFGRYLRRFRRVWIILRDVEADMRAAAARGALNKRETQMFFTLTTTHPTTPPASADPAIPSVVTPNKPSEVLWLDGTRAEVLDVDDPPAWLMQQLTVRPCPIKADAVVFTDRGVHLYYIKPNAPTDAVLSLCDATHRRLAAIEGAFPTFFVSKTTGKPRAALALTSAGDALAAEYNAFAQNL